MWQGLVWTAVDGSVRKSVSAKFVGVLSIAVFGYRPALRDLPGDSEGAP
jgi:hypothetical protein